MRPVTVGDLVKLCISLALALAIGSVFGKMVCWLGGTDSPIVYVAATLFATYVILWKS